MNIEDQIVALATQAHCAYWSPGPNVGEQTKKAQKTCKEWQRSVQDEFGTRFKDEYKIDKGKSQQIDLVDTEKRVAYELKSSPNNIHMELYRDVFKALVLNKRNPSEHLKKLVFIAPRAGIKKLGNAFPEDVKSICKELELNLELREIPWPSFPST